MSFKILAVTYDTRYVSEEDAIEICQQYDLPNPVLIRNFDPWRAFYFVPLAEFIQNQHLVSVNQNHFNTFKFYGIHKKTKKPTEKVAPLDRGHRRVMSSSSLL